MLTLPSRPRNSRPCGGTSLVLKINVPSSSDVANFFTKEFRRTTRHITVPRPQIILKWKLILSDGKLPFVGTFSESSLG